MNAYSVVLKPARVALMLFAASVVFAVVAIVGLAKYRASQEQILTQTGQRLAETRDSIQKLTYDLDSINRLAAQYQRLNRLGFVGKPDRDVWIENLKAIYSDTHLPPTLRYTLAPPQLLNPQPVPAEDTAAHQNNVLHHDLALEISAIHDGEFLDFMDKLGSDWSVPYRVETCQIARDSEPSAGLQIRCELRIYSLPEAEKAP